MYNKRKKVISLMLGVLIIASAWEKWCDRWGNIKNDETQMSLTLGINEKEFNFGQYSKVDEAVPQIRMGKLKDLSDTKELEVVTKEAVKGYKSNKVTARDLEENTTYYYSYIKDGAWCETIMKSICLSKKSYLDQVCAQVEI